MANVLYMTTWLDIANSALGRIGKGRIASLTSDDDLVQYVNTFMGQAVETVLSARAWSIATRVDLVKSSTAPAFGYLYAYDLPTDHINTIAVIADGEYRPEGATILSDSETMSIIYTAKPSDTNAAGLPSYLRRAIAACLAFLLSTALTSSEQLAARIAQEYTLAMDEAVRADARRFQADEPDSWYDEAR